MSRDEHISESDHAGLRSFRLDHTGIRRILGPLEASVLEAVWHLTTENDAWVAIGAVCAQLGPTAHYKTIQTIMNRLVEKRLLERHLQQRAYVYRALSTQAELEAGVTRQVIEGLVRDYGSSAIAFLVKTIQDIHPEQLETLERLANEAARTTFEEAKEGAPHE
jgi:predicted transcriptional regulator